MTDETDTKGRSPWFSRGNGENDRPAGGWIRKRLARLDLTKGRYAVLNLFRWTILASLLLFLLTAILALHEALNFQDRLVELAGNDRERARRVLAILHDTVENPATYTEDRELPYAALAVKLERLSRVQRSLKGFDVEDPSTSPPPSAEAQVAKAKTVSVQQAANGRGDGEDDDIGVLAADYPMRIWQAEQRQLEISIADLEDTLKAGFPARQTVDAINTARRHVDRLARFQGSIEVADETQAPTTGTAHATEADRKLETGRDRYALQDVSEDLKAALETLLARSEILPKDVLIVDQLDTLRREIDGLKRFYGASDLAMKQKAPKPASEKRPLPVNLMVSDIGDRIGEVETLLLEADPGFVAAHKLSKLINETRDFHGRIQGLSRDRIRWTAAPDGHDADGTRARSMFDIHMGDLAEAIQDMEDELGRRTKVMVVADQLHDVGDSSDEGRTSRALAILRAFDAVGRFEATLLPLRPLEGLPVIGAIGRLGFDPQRIATLSRETLALIFVFVIGAIGSVIYITKYSIQLVLEGNWLTDKPRRSLAWYLFRPFFGVIVALAAFLLFKAGQLAMGNSGVADGSGDFNLPVLSVIALFAGLLSWQALEMIETRGASWFRSQKRQFLWATGLDNGLRAGQHSREELASSIGRSVDQVFRWLVYRDRVSPEMQDRIADWLDVPYNQLFQNEEPTRRPVWFKIAPADPAGLSRETFERALVGEHFDPEKLEGWLAQQESVPPMAHDRIILAMNRPMQAIFTDRKPGPPETET